jgi:hypothetical protein
VCVWGGGDGMHAITWLRLNCGYAVACSQCQKSRPQSFTVVIPFELWLPGPPPADEDARVSSKQSLTLGGAPLYILKCLLADYCYLYCAAAAQRSDWKGAYALLLSGAKIDTGSNYGLFNCGGPRGYSDIGSALTAAVLAAYGAPLKAPGAKLECQPSSWKPTDGDSYGCEYSSVYQTCL